MGIILSSLVAFLLSVKDVEVCLGQLAGEEWRRSQRSQQQENSRSFPTYYL
jgi:hypothetical protein